MQALTATVNNLVKSLGKTNSPAGTGGRQKRRQRAANKSKKPSQRATAPTKMGGSGLVTQRVIAPVSESSIIRLRMGISDMSRITFSYVAGFIIVSGSSGGAGAPGTVFFLNNDASSLVSTGFNPIQPANSTWGRSYIADVWKHFARKTYHKITLACVPNGGGDNTSTPFSINLAPYRSGNAATSTASSTGGSATQLAAQNIQGMKDNIQFPCWKTVEMDMTKYIAGGSGALQNEFDERGEVDDQGQTTPCMFAISGVYTANTASPLPATGNMVLASIIVSVNVSLLDFSGGFTASTPELRPKGRSVKPTDEDLIRCLRKMEMDDLKSQSLFRHCKDEKKDLKSDAYELVTRPQSTYVIVDQKDPVNGGSGSSIRARSKGPTIEVLDSPVAGSAKAKKSITKSDG